MSTPYDLDSPEQPPPGGSQPNRPAPSQPPGNVPRAPLGQPAGRASDILRDHAVYQQSPARISNINGGERAATKFDDAARSIFYLALLVMLGALGYLLYGLWGGMVADPNYTVNLSHADHERILGNIAIVTQVLRIAMFVALAAFLFLFYHEETSGYFLLAITLVFDLAIPFATVNILQMDRARESVVTDMMLGSIRTLGWLPGIPGSLLILYDIYRRIAGGLEEAQIRRATLRYGQGVGRQSKHRNVFLGACWNTAFCRDAIRARCPIYVKHKGPCWRHKRGCMCEESIILLAQGGDWKQKVASAVGQLDGQRDLGGGLLSSAPPKIALSMEQKKERCRQCVIYNKHEEQKYKLLVATTFVVVFAAIMVLKSNLVTLVNTTIAAANSVVGHLSFASNSAPAVAGAAPTIAGAQLSGPLTWIILAVVMLVVLSKLLQLVEYCCFKIKI